MRMIILAGAFALVAVSVEAQEPTGIQVAEAVLATDVVDRQPQGADTSFPAGVGRVYLWTRVTGASAGTAIHHVWYRGDEETARVRLDIGGEEWRTWSSKTIPADWTGDWRVDVVGPDDEVIESASFTVG